MTKISMSYVFQWIIRQILRYLTFLHIDTLDTTRTFLFQPYLESVGSDANSFFSFRASCFKNSLLTFMDLNYRYFYYHNWILSQFILDVELSTVDDLAIVVNILNSYFNDVVTEDDVDGALRTIYTFLGKYKQIRFRVVVNHIKILFFVS